MGLTRVLIEWILGMTTPKPKKSEIQSTQRRLRDESSDTLAITEASGFLKELSVQLDLGIK